MQEKLPNPQKIVELLSPLLTAGRKRRIEQILNLRTRYITIILYDLYHEHNMSAVVRSCEAFGLQDCHVIEVENKFSPSHGVAIGAQQWIDIFRYKTPKECLNHLKKLGYKIYAADPPDKAERTKGKNSYNIDDVKIQDSPIAIAFGKELDGLTDEIRQLCDGVVYIPMAGFTESLNVSVTAAICINTLRKKLEKLPTKKWQLSDEEKELLRSRWYIQSLKYGEKILKDLLEREKKRQAA